MQTALPWSRESICIRPTTFLVDHLAAEVYRRTCRTAFDQPGFCAVNCGSTIDSHSFRQWMIDLKRGMAAIHEAGSGQTLAYLSAARFDQQTTTKPHLDAGPDECFLMLGYEPSEVDAEMQIADYTKCAFDMTLSPQAFLTEHNPMFRAGHQILRPYTTRIPCFSRSDYQIICVNNSCAPFSAETPQWQGTLHTATILTPDESKRRVINSTMIASVPIGTAETVSLDEQAEFVRTSLVRRRGYDKSHLKDDG